MFRMTLRSWVLALAALGLAANRTMGMSEILGQSKEQLKLKYDVSVRDLGNGRVTVTFTIADEGRLKPLNSIDLQIPGRDKNPDGSTSPDVALSLATTTIAEGAQAGAKVARFELTKELAGRAEIWLMTRHLDGKQEPLTGYIHPIPIA